MKEKTVPRLMPDAACDILRLAMSKVSLRKGECPEVLGRAIA